MTLPLLDTTPQLAKHPLFHNAYVDVKAHFGATGNGSSDDTTRIQDALDAAVAEGCGVYFPQGLYNVDELATTPVPIIGSQARLSENDPYNGAILNFQPATGTCLLITPQEDTFEGASITGLGFKGPGSGTDTIGLALDGTEFDSVPYALRGGVSESLRVKGFGTGVWTASLYSHSFLGCYCVENGIGLHLTLASNSVAVVNGAYRQNRVGVLIFATSSVTVGTGVVIESNTETGLHVDPGSGNAAGLNISGHFENNPRGILIESSGAGRVYDSCIIAPLIQACSTAHLEVHDTSLLFAFGLMMPDDPTVILSATTDNCQLYALRSVENVTDLGTNNLVGYPFVPPPPVPTPGPFVPATYVEIASDTFTRANGSLGTAENGGTWDLGGGTNTWAITSDKAHNVSGTPTTGPTRAALDIGFADVRLSADITLSGTAGNGFAGLLLRHDGLGTAWLTVALLNQTAGPTHTELAALYVDGTLVDWAATTVTPGATYHLEAIASGTMIDVSVDGETAFTYTLTQSERVLHMTGTEVGMVMAVGTGADDGGSRIDNWLAETIPAYVLAPDGQFYTGKGLAVGNSAAATSLGSVTDKMEVFDAAGASLGYVPIYDSIT